MISYIFQTTFKSQLKFSRLVGWGAVILVVFLFAKVWSVLAPDLSPMDSFDRVYQALGLRVVALACAIFSTLVVSQELENKTIIYWITRPIPRSHILLGRMLAACCLAMIVSWLACLACAVAVLGPHAFSPRLGLDLLVMAMGCFAYTGFFVFLSLVISKSLLVSLLFAFGWETFVPNMPGDMVYGTVLTFLRAAGPKAIVAGPPTLGDFATGSFASPNVSSQMAWIVLLLLVLGFWSLAMWWFSRFEFSPREEAA